MYERLEFEQANLASGAALDATFEPFRLYSSSCGVLDKAGDRRAGRTRGRALAQPETQAPAWRTPSSTAASLTTRTSTGSWLRPGELIEEDRA